ncbi:hypothetical protein Fcan01_14526 [Folsomia candida]|uniref:Uncharacterized protein n=1 Tax=Folsomia candida TaxID=158441 RepID=A0A226E3Z3_FOLCA|nr:hypothetical protein Fcan01_14526 [Folsomia candida]
MVLVDEKTTTTTMQLGRQLRARNPDQAVTAVAPTTTKHVFLPGELDNLDPGTLAYECVQAAGHMIKVFQTQQIFASIFSSSLEEEESESVDHEPNQKIEPLPPPVESVANTLQRLQLTEDLNMKSRKNSKTICGSSNETTARRSPSVPLTNQQTFIAANPAAKRVRAQFNLLDSKDGLHSQNEDDKLNKSVDIFSDAEDLLPAPPKNKTSLGRQFSNKITFDFATTSERESIPVQPSKKFIYDPTEKNVLVSEIRRSARLASPHPVSAPAATTVEAKKSIRSQWAQNAPRKRAESVKKRRETCKKFNDEWQQKVSRIKLNRLTAAHIGHPPPRISHRVWDNVGGLKPRRHVNSMMKHQGQFSNVRTLFDSEPGNSYEITRYEDFDEELKHREDKVVPAWVNDKLEIQILLFKQLDATKIKRFPFPSVKQGYRLFNTGR